MNNTLQLSIIKTPVGELETNVQDLKNFVAEKLKEYDPEKYTGDVKQAKTARAELNKSCDYVKDGRKQLEEAMRKPYLHTLDALKEIEGDIQTASGNIDAIVKAIEAKEKEQKKAAIQAYWNTSAFKLFDLDRVFDQTWLNKTTKLTDVKKAIDDLQAKTYTELQVIERLPDDVEMLKAMYLDTLDISATLQKADQLKANRERIKQEQAERAQREMGDQQSELTREEIRTERESVSEKLASEALGNPVDTDPEMTYTLTFTAKRSKLFALRQYMTDNGIKYTREGLK